MQPSRTRFLLELASSAAAGLKHLAILAALGSAACVGHIGDDGDVAAPGQVGPCKVAASLAPARISILSDAQYVNVVRDVFGVTFMGDVTVAPSTSGVYGVNELAQLTTAKVQAYLRAAKQVAASIQPCGTKAVNTSCMEDYLRDKLPLAWRRPVTDAEISALMTIFESGMPDGTDRAIEIAMEAALGSPSFLYRTEIGDHGGKKGEAVALTPYELASAASFALLDSTPDPELWAKAEDGSLKDPTVLADQVRRLMALPAVRDNLKRKVSYYLNFEKVPFVTKDPVAFPSFTSLKEIVYESSQKFLDDVIWDGRFEDLFTSRRVYANEAMAKEYGLPPVSGPELVPVTTTGAAYSAGVLTQPALLLSTNIHAGSDDIVHRGLWVYTNLACGITIGAPPADATSVFAKLTGTEREKALKRDAMSCGGCHAAFDPFGLVTQNYDPIGRYRTEDPETGGPIDTSADIQRVGEDVDGHVEGVADVAQKLLDGRRASDCAAVQLAKFTLDHNPDVEGSCAIMELKDAFADTGSFPELFTAILTSPAFRTRDF